MSSQQDIVLVSDDGVGGDRGDNAPAPDPSTAANGADAKCDTWNNTPATAGTDGVAGGNGGPGGRGGDAPATPSCTVTVNNLSGDLAIGVMPGTGGTGGAGGNGANGQNGGNGGAAKSCESTIADGGTGGDGGGGGTGGDGGTGSDGANIAVLYVTRTGNLDLTTHPGNGGKAGSGGAPGAGGNGGFANGGRGQQAAGGGPGKPGAFGNSGLPGTPGSAISKHTSPQPILSDLSPSSGPQAGGTAFTLTGSNFQDGARLTFGEAEVTDLQFINSQTITGTTPQVDEPGDVFVILYNPDGGIGVLNSQFSYT